jgi:hypothetical protein
VHTLAELSESINKLGIAEAIAQPKSGLCMEYLFGVCHLPACKFAHDDQKVAAILVVRTPEFTSSRHHLLCLRIVLYYSFQVCPTGVARASGWILASFVHEMASYCATVYAMKNNSTAIACA